LILCVRNGDSLKSHFLDRYLRIRCRRCRSHPRLVAPFLNEPATTAASSPSEPSQRWLARPRSKTYLPPCRVGVRFACSVESRFVSYYRNCNMSGEIASTGRSQRSARARAVDMIFYRFAQRPLGAYAMALCFSTLWTSRDMQPLSSVQSAVEVPHLFLES